MFQRLWMKGTARLALLLTLAAVACHETPQTETKALAPELNLERVRFRVWRGAELRARGEARQISIRRDTTGTTAEDLRAELPGGGTPVTVTAPQGDGILSASTFQVRGGVVMTRGDARATTDHARYAPGADGAPRITGDAPVTVERPGFRLDGVGFTYDLVTDVLDLGGPIQARYARGGGG
jgi:lipopolysaccharide export system protein LptC